MKKAQENQDKESIDLERAGLVKESISLISGIIRPISPILGFALGTASSVVKVVGPYFGRILPGISIATSLITLTTNAYLARGMSQFRSSFLNICSKETNARDKSIESLEYLRGQLTLSSEEATPNNGDPEPAKKKEAKYKSFTRKVGADVAAEVSNKVNVILRNLQSEDPIAQSNALEEAKVLINKVDRASFAIRIKQIATIVFCIISITACILTLAFGGPVAPLLFVIAGILTTCINTDSFNSLLTYLTYPICKSWSWETKKVSRVDLNKPEEVMHHSYHRFSPERSLAAVL